MSGNGHVAAPPPVTTGEGAEAEKLRGQDPMETLLKKYFDPGALLQYQQIEHANKYQPGNKLKAVFTELQRMFENAKSVFQNPHVSEEKKQEVARKLEEAVNRYGNRTHKQPWELLLSAAFNQRPLGALLGTIIKLLVAYLYTSRKTRNLADELEALKAAGPGLTTDPDALRRAGVDVVSGPNDPDGGNMVRTSEGLLLTPAAYQQDLETRHASSVEQESSLEADLVGHGANPQAALAAAADFHVPVGEPPADLTAPSLPGPSIPPVGNPAANPDLEEFNAATQGYVAAEAANHAEHSAQSLMRRDGPPYASASTMQAPATAATAMASTPPPPPSQPRPLAESSTDDDHIPGMA